MLKSSVCGLFARRAGFCAFFLCAICFAPVQALAAGEDAAFRRALDLAEQGEWQEALAAAPAGPARMVIAWQTLRDGEGQLGNYEDFLQHYSDWPGVPLLRKKGEVAVARSQTPARVIAYFGTNAPRSDLGAVSLVRALFAQGKSAQAAQVARQAWRDLSFSEEQQNEMLKLAPRTLASVHEARYDALLWDGKWSEAARMQHLVPQGLRAVAAARQALRRNQKGVDSFINAVPADYAANPGLAYDRFVWRMRRDRYDGALEVILEQSRDAESLGRPSAWAARRKSLAHRMMRDGHAIAAYNVAASHQLISGGSYADLEFLAGFIALRQIGDAERGLAHFQRLEAAVSTPISVSRALYWQGRAYEAAGQIEMARAAYEQAAQHQTAYYGLLASERLGLKLNEIFVQNAHPVTWQNALWTHSSVHRAALSLRSAGDMVLAKRFWLHLAESLDETGLAQMAAMAHDLGEPHLEVLIGKAAARRGLILDDAYFPVAELVPDNLAVSRAFALAIARRESEFHIEARSGANARGLMQLLPKTAKEMARKLKMEYQLGKLTEDPAYNVKLGSAYLAHLQKDFGTSIALLASGYNAGPSRARRWSKAHGDPRDPAVDVIDWVEMIPFEETRTYVMRVIEGVIIYRAKLRGTSRPVNVSAELRG